MPGENEGLCLVENTVSHSDGTRLAQSRESSHWKQNLKCHKGAGTQKEGIRQGTCKMCSNELLSLGLSTLSPQLVVPPFW